MIDEHNFGRTGTRAALNRGDRPNVEKRVQRIIIVDKHTLVRNALKILLELDLALKVIGEAGDGHVALELCRSLCPDIVITDLCLPSLGGLEAISLIRDHVLAAHVLVLCGSVSEERAAAALDAGAHGYVLKINGIATLRRAIDGLPGGGVFIDPLLDARQIDGLRRNGQETRKVDAKVRLTSRERQILKLIAEGARNRDIAERLSISKKTVETHRLNAMQKLNAHNAAELSQWARRLGLMSD